MKSIEEKSMAALGYNFFIVLSLIVAVIGVILGNMTVVMLAIVLAILLFVFKYYETESDGIVEPKKVDNTIRSGDQLNIPEPVTVSIESVESDVPVEVIVVKKSDNAKPASQKQPAKRGRKPKAVKKEV